jgi:uncharacterized repeat protein (TIGR03803 family)
MAIRSRIQSVEILCLALNCLVLARAQTATETVLHNFHNPPRGAQPSNSEVLALDSAGNLYGTATAGGAANAGTVYKVTPAGVQTLLYSFTGGADGNYPSAGVIGDSQGNLYGTTQLGGLPLANCFGSGCFGGVVFKLDASGKETVLHSFTGGADGGTPLSGLVRDSAGNLYGTTFSGGADPSQYGVVYKLDAAGKETVLYSFQGFPDGYFPSTGVIRDSAGNLYGTTVYGGTSDCGTIYKIDTSGQETILYDIPCTIADFNPVPGPLIRDSAGNLYGFLSQGGATDSGALFELDTKGVFTVLYSFTGGVDGAFPDALVRDSAGNLYGTTDYGGSTDPFCQPYFGCGLVYELNTAGQFSVLYNFTGGANGYFPGGLARDSNGNLYGVSSGGTLSFGTVWELSAAGQQIILTDFSAPADGTEPLAGLLRDSAGNLYGTTELGGPANAGIVFRISASGRETILYRFTGASDGANPYGGLVQDSAGNLYGTTSAGGAAGLGVVYMLDTSGQETVLHSFTGSPDGSAPLGGVIRNSAGNLYGTTSAGGKYNNGTVFELDASGQEIILHNFHGDPDGAAPYSGVFRDAAGNLYGTTLLGGVFNDGIVYELDPAGKETVLHTFSGDASGSTDGAFPYAGVVLDAAGNLYGTTFNGGSPTDTNFGTVYTINAAGQESVLYAFSGTDGQEPTAGLVLDAAGNLYGTAGGGASYNGVVFELTPAGVQTVLHFFTGSDGSSPYAGVIRDSDGNLYGTTASGGTGNAGVVYKIAP